MEPLEEILQGIATVNQNLEQLKSMLEQLKQKPDIHGRIDLNNSVYHLHLEAWNRAIIQLHLIQGELSRIEGK